MRCDVGVTTVHYRSYGTGRPFLLLHGSPGDSLRAAEAVEPAFRDRRGWRRVYPDLPGHGHTRGDPRIRDLDDYLEVVVEFADRLRGGGRIALGGISFGAYLALGIARRFPDRLDGLLLSVPEVHFDAREDRRDARSPGPREPSPEVAVRIWRGYREETAWLEGLPWHDLSLDVYGKFPAFAAPALFLLGRQDAAFRYRQYGGLLAGFPHATYAVLDGAGHGLWHDRPGLTTALVRDWIDRVDAASPRPVVRPSRRRQTSSS